MNLKHQTKEQFLARLKTELDVDSKHAYAYLQNAIDASEFTDTELRTALGMNATQLASLKSKAKKVRDAKQLLEGMK